jgi:hypothetical protein
VAFVAAGLAACAEEDGPAEPAGPDPILAEDFPAAFAHAYCDDLGPCCSSAGLAHDGAACITTMTAEAQDLLSQAPPLRKYDPVSAGQCIADLKALWPTCRTSPAAEEKAQEACQGIFTGTVAVGGACQSDHDCAPSSQGPVHCEVNVNMPVPPAPICVVDPPGKLDEPCIGSAPYEPATPFPHLRCEDSLYCDRAINRCRQRHGEGEDCNPSMLCESTLWCHATGPTSGACEKTLALGAPCTFHGQCASGVCLPDVCRDGIPVDAAKCGGP